MVAGLKTLRLALYPLARIVVALVAWLLVVGGYASGQEFAIDAPSRVEVGVPFQVSYTLNASPEEVSLPNMRKVEGLTLMGGPSEATSRSFQMINGQTSQSVQSIYSYVLRAEKAGTLQLPGASAKVDGKPVSCKGVTIEAVKGTGGSVGGGGGGGQQRVGGAAVGRQGATSGDIKQDIRLVIELNKRTSYVNEPIVATIKLYTRHPIVQFDDMKFPEFKGFWSSTVERPNTISFERAVLEGREYQMGILTQYVLFPQQSGALKINPAQLDLQYRPPASRTSIFDEWMGVMATDRASIRSPELTIQVKPLPQAPNASAAQGAVGQLKMKTSISSNSTAANEPVTYTITLSGDGNFHLLEAPKLSLPASVEVFGPTLKPNYRINAGRQSGSLAYEYVLIPRTADTLRIAPYEFTYFNYKTGKYATDKDEGYTVAVTGGSGGGPQRVAGGPQVAGGYNTVGSDIEHISSRAGTWRERDGGITRHAYYWLLVLLVVAGFAGAFVWLMREDRLAGDATLRREQRARRMARHRLAKAERLIEGGEGMAFYEELNRALNEYLGGRLRIAVADLSRQRVSEELSLRSVDESVSSQVMGTLDACEAARYGAGATSQSRRELHTKAAEAIATLDAQLSRAHKSKEDSHNG